MEIYLHKSTPFLRWIFAIILLILFIVLSSFVAAGKTAGFDDTMMTSFEAMRDPFITSFAKGITFFANTLTIIILCLILLFIPSRMTFGAPVVLITIVTSLFNFILKQIINRDRPDDSLWLVDADGYSFPSGHTITSVVFYISLMILLRRYFNLRGQRTPAFIVTVIFSILTVLIGFSRIYLGVHYPTDVIGGWLLGSIMMIIGITVYDYTYPQKFILSYEPPGWGFIKKKRPWKKPVHSGKDSDPIDIPKFRDAWRKPKLSPKAEREREAEKEAQKKIAEETKPSGNPYKQ